MHLPDVRELAAIVRTNLEAGEVTINVSSDGWINVQAWKLLDDDGKHQMIASVGRYNKNRSFDDVLADIDAYVARRNGKIMTNADLGLDADGRFINQQAAE
jgi:hypothetical protein